MPSRNTIEILITARDNASLAFQALGGNVDGLERSWDHAKAGIALGAAITIAALGSATSAAIAYNEQMTNVAAVLGQTREEQAATSAEILRFSANTRAGASEVAAAYYDIVGGVIDATTHMAILEQSVATAEAGAARLTGTTSALISVMNSYGFSAEEAAYASDVLTQTVGMGVGTMEELASAIPSVAGLAASMGVEFEDLGAMLALVSTKGYSWSQAATQINAVMSALLTPNAQMNRLLAESGLVSGRAAVEALGLAGAVQTLYDTAATSGISFEAALGRQEAILGAVTLTGGGAASVMREFTDSVTGATAAARDIQLSSPAAQLDLFRSSVERLRIEIGNQLMPVVSAAASTLQPAINAVSDWAAANPEATQSVIALVGATATLVPILIGLPPALNAIRAASVVLLGGLNPLTIAAIVLGAAFATNLGGIRDFLVEEIFPVIGAFGELVAEVVAAIGPVLRALWDVFSVTIGAILDLLRPFIDLLAGLIRMVTGLIRLLRGDLGGAMQSFGAPTSPIQQQLQRQQQMAMQAYEAGRNRTGAATALNFGAPVDTSAYFGGSSTPYGGVAYSNPETQYQADLYQAQQQAAGMVNNINVTVPETSILTQQQAQQNAQGFGEELSAELRRQGL